MEIIKYNNKKITKNQLKEIQNDSLVKTLILERKNFIEINGKNIFFENYKPCKVIFHDKQYMHVFIKEEDFL